MFKKGFTPWNKGISPSKEMRERISSTLKKKYSNGTLKTGFQKGHPCYSYNLREWMKDHDPWNKGLTGEKSHSYGRVFTSERRRKIAIKLKNNRNSFGYRHSEETKEKLSKSHKGRKWTEERIEKASGENHWAWIRDRSIVERNKRNDAAYLQWVKQVKKRDENSCKLKNQECSGYNVVHHILKWSEYPELRYKINNGITLCQVHHPRKRIDEQRLIPVLKLLVGSSIKI